LKTSVICSAANLYNLIYAFLWNSRLNPALLSTSSYLAMVQVTREIISLHLLGMKASLVKISTV